MKLISILIILMTLVLNSYGQKCIVKSDPISGKTTIQSKSVHLAWVFDFKYDGGEKIDFFATFNYLGEHNVEIAEGTKITFKLNNDKILTFTSAKSAMPISQATQYGVSTSYTFAFKLSKEEIKALANDKIVFMRYPSTDGESKDYTFRKSLSSKFTKSTTCLSENF